LDPRLKSAVVLYVFFVLGMFLLFVPWTPIWDRAVVSIAPSRAMQVLSSGWVRGAVSGLGLLDLVLAVQELLTLTGGSGEKE